MKIINNRSYMMEETTTDFENNATRVVASTLGVLVGLAGVDHGIFEILQGNAVPESVMISASGPEHRFWEFGTETALTLVPNFLITGILAILVGLCVTIWSIFFIDRKHGALILMLLSILLFLVGGGFAPIFMAVVASLTASRIDKPLTFWRKLLAGGVGRFLDKIWLASLIAFVLLFILSVEIAIFGWPLTSYFDAETAFNHLNTLSYIMLVLMVLAVVAGFAHDLQRSDARYDRT